MSKKITGVYKLIATPEEKSVKIKHLDSIKMDKNTVLRDTLVDSFYISDERKIYVDVYACNVTNFYLIQNKKQPLYCFIVKYYKQLQKRELGRLYLNFNINDNIKSEKEFLNKKINGVFSLNMTIDNIDTILDEDMDSFKDQEDIINTIKTFLTKEAIQSFFIDIADKSDSDREKECGVEYSNAIPPVVTYVRNDQ